MKDPLGVSPSKGNQITTPPKSSRLSLSRSRSSIGRVTVDLTRRSWVRFPPRSKEFFFTSCGSLIPFTRANAKWVFHRFHIAFFNLHFRVNSLFHHCVHSATRDNIHMTFSIVQRINHFLSCVITVL